MGGSDGSVTMSASDEASWSADSAQRQGVPSEQNPQRSAGVPGLVWESSRTALLSSIPTPLLLRLLERRKSEVEDLCRAFSGGRSMAMRFCGAREEVEEVEGTEAAGGGVGAGAVFLGLGRAKTAVKSISKGSESSFSDALVLPDFILLKMGIVLAPASSRLRLRGTEGPTLMGTVGAGAVAVAWTGSRIATRVEVVGCEVG